MQGENILNGNGSTSKSKTATNNFTIPDDLGKLVGDASFSDLTSDDSSGWMHKIDVSTFQQLTSGGQILPQADPLYVKNYAGHLEEQDEEEDAESYEDEEEYVEIKKEAFDPDDEPVERRKLYRATPADERFEIKKKEAKAQRRRRPSTPSAISSKSTERQPRGLYVLGPKKISPPIKKSRLISAYRQTTLDDDGNAEQYQIPIVSSSSSVVVSGSHRQYPKPVYSYSCMIALALKNSQNGRLQVAEIYCFMCENYPYFRTAPAGWKNSVRHNLSLNKCFEKIELEAPGGHGRKCCLWKLNPQKVTKMEQEIKKYREKDPEGVRNSYARPEDVELVESGMKGMPSTAHLYHTNSSIGRALPDAGHRVHRDKHSAHIGSIPQSLLSVDTGVGAVRNEKYAGELRLSTANGQQSQLALKLLQEAAVERAHFQWPPPSQPTRPWQPSVTEIDNNRIHFCSINGVQHCPLEFSPPPSSRRLQDHMLHAPSTPPASFSTPVRSNGARHQFTSPVSYSQPIQQHRSNNQFYQSNWGQSNSPLFFDPSWLCGRPAADHGANVQASNPYRTPDRPASCGYFFNEHSLLSTPTANDHHRGPSTFGMSLEAAYSAANTHNNSLILQTAALHQETQYADDAPSSGTDLQLISL